MKNINNKIRLFVIGLLVIGTMVAGITTVNILHKNQLANNKSTATQNLQLNQATVLSSQNSLATKTITTPKTNKQTIQKNAETETNADNNTTQKTDLTQPTPTPNPVTNYNLFVTSLNGTVTSNPSGISCGSTCTTTFSSGTSVTLSALAASGYTFSGWSGVCSGTGNCTMVMNSNQSVTAGYTSTNTNTNTSTTYTSSQIAAHNTSTDCWVAISGNVYNLTAFIPLHPGGSSAIIGLCGTDGTVALSAAPHGLSVVPTIASYIIGTLVASTNHILSVSNSGTGSGIVSGGGINCGTTCSTTVNSGASVTLTETPASGSTFSGWGGACTGTGSCTVTLNSNQNITANFTTSSNGNGGGTSTTYTLSVTSANGTVTSNPSAISCGSTCSATLKSGTSIILVIIPNSGYKFSGWGGACTGTGSCTVAMSANKNVTASYTAN